MPDRIASLPPRVSRWIKVDESGCWLWAGRLDTWGYGQTRYGEDGYGGNGAPFVPIHRLVYHLLVDRTVSLRPGKGGDTIDHLCRVRHCVRPEHLEPVSRAENIRRGWEARRA